MKTVCTMAIVLTVWALPAQAVRNAERGATRKQDASPPVLAVQLSEPDRAVAEANPLLRGPRARSRRMVPKLGPAPKVHLTAEQIVDAVRSAQAKGAGDVLIVDCSGEGDHTAIQAAIVAASDGDVIIVLPNTCNEDGHYFELINFLGKAITVQNLDPEDPESVAATVIHGSSSVRSPVRFINGETESSVLDGLTITGGSGTLIPLENAPKARFHNGGGILCFGASPTIRNCRIISNSAAWGGGIGVRGGAPSIINCQISSNLSYVETDGTWTVAALGGGISVWDGSAVISESQIVDNLIDATSDRPLDWGYGVGVMIWINPPHASDVEINNCLIQRNVLINGDGQSFGGGLFAYGIGNPIVVVRNSLITDNQAPYTAGIWSLSNLTLLGCTIAGNTGPSGYGLKLFDGSPPAVLQNTIIQQNLPADTALEDISLFSASYSNVDTEDGSVLDGPGNINTDPLFVEPDKGDYHLTAESPCIDTGDPKFVPEEGETDIDREPRVVGERVDMGADEFLMTCVSDLDGSGDVDAADLAILLGSWGPCPDCPADFDGNGSVNAPDLAQLLGAWGECP